MDGDKLATLTGYVLAAGGAAVPIFNAVGTGSLHGTDYFALAVAIITAIFGHKTALKGGA